MTIDTRNLIEYCILVHMYFVCLLLQLNFLWLFMKAFIKKNERDGVMKIYTNLLYNKRVFIYPWLVVNLEGPSIQFCVQLTDKIMVGEVFSI